jgi:hypothetical protein
MRVKFRTFTGVFQSAPHLLLLSGVFRWSCGRFLAAVSQIGRARYRMADGASRFVLINGRQALETPGAGPAHPSEASASWDPADDIIATECYRSAPAPATSVTILLLSPRVLPAMRCRPFFEMPTEESEPSVRVVLGHFIFVYIHPYMDGTAVSGGSS